MSTVAILVNRSAIQAFRQYSTLRDMRGMTGRGEELVAYYQQRGSWEGVESLLAEGVTFSDDRSGILLGATSPEIGPEEKAKQPDVLLTDADGQVVFDSNGELQGEQLSRLVEDLRELALADAGQLDLNVRHTDVAQVLRNLLVNALRHTPPDGSVTVTAARVGRALEIAGADTGEGIPPDDLPHVFERFWRTDPARSRGDGEAPLGSGTGLGLAVAQSLVEAQGGRIWVESALGEGSVFLFTLPLARLTW